MSSGENTGAGEVSCISTTSNGDHSHPLVIPPEDVAAGLAEKTYTLEDGGTGHTHTVTLTAYDFLYLGGGNSTTVASTMDEGHSHQCNLACSAGPVCLTSTDNGDHSHPLVIPGEDVTAGYAEKTYPLEDGGTGHTHMVTLTAYDFLYLQSGAGTTIVSTMDEGHSHPCQISCTGA